MEIDSITTSNGRHQQTIDGQEDGHHEFMMDRKKNSIKCLMDGHKRIKMEGDLKIWSDG